MRRCSFGLLAVALCAVGFVHAAESTGVWLDVPFVKQEKNGCGAASIAMVIQFWQRQQGQTSSVDSEATVIQRSLYSSRAHGIYADDLEGYLKQRGFRTFAFQGTRTDLQQHLAKGRPLIVALKPLGSGRGVPLHYVVVTGIEPEQNLILLNDPAERKLLKQELPLFEKEWNRAGHWTLLAVPQTEDASSGR